MGIGYWVEVSKIEERRIAVVSQEINALTRSSRVVNEANQLAEETRSFMSNNHLWIRVFDRNAKPIREIHNPAQSELIRAPRAKTVPIPTDSIRYSEIITLDGTTVVRIPVNQPASDFGAFTNFEGAFVLDPQHLRHRSSSRKLDSTGYLQDFAAKGTPLNSRIFAMINVSDALMSQRPYKPPLPLTAALSILRDGCEMHFEPVQVNAFTTIAEQVHQKANGKSEHALSECWGIDCHAVSF